VTFGELAQARHYAAPPQAEVAQKCGTGPFEADPKDRLSGFTGDAQCGARAT
jgi:hypothetical protein